MTIEYTKTNSGNMWTITKHYSFLDEPKKEIDPNISPMSIMRNNNNKISGGPVIAYFIFELEATEYINFKNNQKEIE